MPRRLTAHRAWPASPAGDGEAIDAVAREIAGSADAERYASVRLALVRESLTLLERLRRQGCAPTRAQAFERLRRLHGAAACLADLCAGLDPVTRGLLAVAMEAPADHVAASLARALAHAADVARRDLVRATAPTPGPGNLADRLWGDPRLALCHACCRVIASFAASSCSSSPGGLLHRTAAAVWDHATGEDAEDAGLERYLALAVRQGRNSQIA